MRLPTKPLYAFGQTPDQPRLSQRHAAPVVGAADAAQHQLALAMLRSREVPTTPLVLYAAWYLKYGKSAAKADNILTRTVTGKHVLRRLQRLERPCVGRIIVALPPHPSTRPRGSLRVNRIEAVVRDGALTIVPGDPRKADEAEFIMLRDGVIAFEGNAAELRASHDEYIRTFLS